MQGEETLTQVCALASEEGCPNIHEPPPSRAASGILFNQAGRTSPLLCSAAHITAALAGERLQVGGLARKLVCPVHTARSKLVVLQYQAARSAWGGALSVTPAHWTS